MDWIKIMCNILDHRKIKMIRKSPDGDTLALLWLLLLVEGGKSNRGGYLMISDSVPYTEETISMITDISLTTVRLGLSIFEQLGMIDRKDNGAIYIRNWRRYQSADKLEDRRKKDRLRQQRHRERQREKLLGAHAEKILSRDSNVTMSRDVTQENRQEQNRVEKTTTEHVRSLLAGTPFIRIAEGDLQSLIERHGPDRVLLAADVAAETWKRAPKDRHNPGAYLNSLCASLIIPEWYVPFADRKKSAEESLRRKKKIEEEQAVQKAREEKERMATETLWNSMPDEQRKEYLKKVRAGLPAGVAPPDTVIEIMARGLAGQQFSRARMIEGTARSCGK